MIVPVAEDSRVEWATLCAELWPDHTVESMLAEKAGGGYEDEFLYWLESEPVALLSLALRYDYVEGAESSPVGYIEGIYVKPQHRHKGIARELVEYAKEWSVKKGCAELASDCELHNEMSRKFHHHVGFQEANTIVCFMMKLV